jgi:glycosyltransferase involved in cell wall biosynthesis
MSQAGRIVREIEQPSAQGNCTGMGSRMQIVHLTASAFFGGPERQMLGLAQSLPPSMRSAFLSFSEGGRCKLFLEAARRRGFEAQALCSDTPHLAAAARELTEILSRLQTDVLCCNGYKANLVGRIAARRANLPVVAVSRGWTRENLKVRFYEALDRWHLRWMDRIVCVSEAQEIKVRQAGVRPDRIRVIHNAVDLRRFADPDPSARDKLARCFRRRPTWLVGAAGRLSPEKGFDVLVEAAARVRRVQPDAGFMLFGEGQRRRALQRQIAAAGLSESFVLDGFRADLDCFLPHFDIVVLPSYTEGLPNIVLEACAAGVPVIATVAGGTPEILKDGAGVLVPPGDPGALADAIAGALSRGDNIRDLGEAGRRRVAERFTFAAQAERYQELFAELCPWTANHKPGRSSGRFSATATCEA